MPTEIFLRVLIFQHIFYRFYLLYIVDDPVGSGSRFQLVRLSMEQVRCLAYV